MGSFQKILKPTRARGLDTSGNNNHAQIYSGRGLEFDGVTDYLTADSAASLADSDFTAALWIKPTLDGYVAGPGGRILFSFHEGVANNRLFFYIVGTNKNIRGYSASGPDQSNTTGALSESWERLVITKEGTSLKFYRNGTADGTSTLQDTVSGSEKFSIGSEWDAGPVASDFYLGMMSDFQMWNSVWTADDVTYDYLNPEQLALNRGGTSLTNSNLKLWYPMNEGHRGNQSFILDASNTGIVSASLDYDFTTDTTSEWAAANDGEADDRGAISYVADGFLRVTYTGTSGAVLNKTSALISGKNYKVTFRAKGTHDAIFASIGNNSDIGYAASNPTLTTDWQDYEFYITATQTLIRFYQAAGPSAGQTLDIDNILVQPINDKNNATTAFYGDEMIANDRNQLFDEAGQWAGYNGPATSEIDGGKFKVVTDGDDTTQGATLAVANLTAPVVGRTYRIWAKLDDTGASANADAAYKFMFGGGDALVTASDGSPSDGTINTTEQEYYADIVATSTTGDLIIKITSSTNDAATTFTIDDVSVKEVGTATGWTDADQQLDIPQTALQSYNQLAWFDGYDDKLAVTEFNFEDGQSINMWVFINDTSTYRDFFGIASGTENYMRLDSSDPTEKFQFEADDNTVILIDLGAAGVIPKGEWVMWTWIWNSDRTIDVYKNSELLASSSATADSADGTRLKIDSFGNAQAGAVNMQGAITEISHYTDILSQAEIIDLYNDGKAKSALEASGSGGLSAYWRNNGLAQWDDLKGSNNGTVTCSETMLITAGVDSSRDSQGFLMNRQRATNSLNQTSETSNTFGADLGETSTFAAGAAFSITLWAKPTDITDNKIMGDTGTDYIAFKDTNELQIEANDVQDNFTINAPSSWTVDEWVHIGIVRNTSNLITTYINGVAQSDTETVDEAFDYRYIGGVSDSKFRGELDDICIYSDELGVAEVLRNYNAGKRSHR